MSDISKIMKEKRDAEERLRRRDGSKMLIYKETVGGDKTFVNPDNLLTSAVESLNTLTGDVTISGSGGIIVSETGQDIEIDGSAIDVGFPDFMDIIDDGTYEGLAVYDDPPGNTNIVALVGKKDTKTSVYLEDSQSDFQPGELTDVEAVAAGLELVGTAGVGDVTYIFRGAWITGTAYVENDCVSSGGDTWRAKRTVVATTTAPAENDDWTEIVTGSYAFPVPAGINKVDVLVVAGGGGGAGGHDNVRFSGGGGGGEQVYNTDHAVTPGAEISVTVGPGGTGGPVASAGSGGSDSVFGTITALGGNGAPGDNPSGVTSSGGAAQSNSGAGGDGGNPGSNGGAGTEFFGVTRAGGGGGSRSGLGVNGGGNGGGISAVGSPGTANTGGGGGGGDPASGGRAGGDGGSGIVIIRYADFGGYAEHGNRIALPVDLTDLGTDPGLEIKWTSTEPVGTDVTIETAVKGETSHTDEAVGTGDGVEDTFYLDYYPAERHSDVVVSVDGTPTAEFTRANADDPREIIFNAGHEPGNTLAVTATYTGVTRPSETAEVQTLYLGGASGGTFDLGITGDMATLAYDDVAATIETALEAIFGAGLVTVADDPGAGDFIITFSVRVRASALTADFTSLTGATAPTLTVTTAYSAGDWAEQTTATAITSIPAGSLVGQHLWIRQTLETDDPAETPTLTEAEVYYGVETFGLFSVGGVVNNL